MKTFIIIDANALIHRAFHALPPLKTKEGKVVNALYGFSNILFKIIRDFKPDYLAAAFDVSRETFRSKEYIDYKAKRTKAPQELYDQFPLIKEVLKILEIPIYEKQGYEADDVIGTIVDQTKKYESLENIILTGDMDALQLVSTQTKVCTFKTGISKTFIFGIQEVKERFNLKPEQLIDYKALRGDPSDNIPGVPGVGEKTAKDLIMQFKSLDNLYSKLETSSINEKLKSRLLEYRKEAYQSQHLVTIVKNVDIGFNLKDCQWSKYNKDEVTRFLEKFEFKTLINKLP